MKSFSLKHTIEKYERHISSVALIGGFIFDNLTLNRIDSLLDQLLIIVYLCVAGITVAWLSRYEGVNIRGKWHSRWHAFMLIALQFVLGGLFSAFFVFYFRSSTLSVSWPFLLMLAALLIGNEFLRKRYQVIIFRAIIFFIALFSYFIFLVPILAHRVGDDVFIGSGLVTLAVFYLFTKLFSWLAREQMRDRKFHIWTSIMVVYAVINVFYFFNIIPPIPLALKEGFFAQSLSRQSDGSYVITREDDPWYALFKSYPVVHAAADGTMYVYSAIFAPTQLRTEVVHEWQYFDTATGNWKTSHRVEFSILGGLDRGYRGFSLKYDIFPARWRVNIENERGQLIGRVKFEVVPGPSDRLEYQIR